MNRFDTLGLIFEKSDPDTPALSFPTRARIYLKTFTVCPAEGFSEPIHALTPFEYDPDTFDFHADRLIENIQELKKAARVRFKNARERELAALKRR